jgi:hypothetical protein
LTKYAGSDQSQCDAGNLHSTALTTYSDLQIRRPPHAFSFLHIRRGILPQPGARCIAVIVMPKLDDIMPFVTPQIALLVLGALVLLIVTVVLVTLALRD